MIQKSKTKKRLITGILTMVGITFLMSLFAFLNPLGKWQLKLTSHLYNRQAPSDDIVIIGIDENSIDDEKGLGRFNGWSILYYDQVLKNIEAANPKTVTFDILFSQKSRGISEQALNEILAKNLTAKEYIKETISYLDAIHPEDEIFSTTLQQFNNIILGESFISAPGTNIIQQAYPPLELFKENTEIGNVYMKKDPDEIIRRIPFSVWNEQMQTAQKTLAVKIIEIYNKELITSLNENLDKNKNFLINYNGKPYSYNIISFIDAYNGAFDGSEIKDKIVLIGVISKSIQDHTMTPTSYDTPMPGVEVHANAIQTILEEKFLHEQSVASQTITISILTALLVTTLLILGVIPGLVITILTIAGYYLSGQFFFNHGLIINFVYPILALFAAYLTITLYKSIAETQEKKQLTSAFSKYVNKDLVAQIANNPDVLKLGGEKRTVTVFFSDIENSTSLSEKMDPETLVSLLNEYFTAMTDIILKNKGTVNKFEGDAIMAFWGAPIPEPQHAMLAAQSAIECRVAIKTLHEKWQKENKPLIEFRIGLASGEVIAGNIGSQDRFDYTVMGDIVNLGSRLEGANKEYGTRIMISDLTFAAIKDEFETRHLDHLRVKGKEHPVDVYELLTFKGKLEDRHRQIIDTFHTAMTLYHDGKFIEAEQKFQDVKKLAPLDKTTDIYLTRLATLKQNPPANWDGTWTLETK
ncbi:MAG: adenylate/guanylate cyclase domain-containing protein [Candidatus Gracilibacteria bacterium]